MKREFFLFATIFFLSANYCLAGFGISPPYVASEQLLPGSHYEQQITLVRSEEDAKSEGKISVSIDAPEIASWISIDKGVDFVFPAGEKFVFMNVRIDVPKDVPQSQYRGKINANLIQSKGQIAGGSAVALGAVIDINLKVGGDVIEDFSIYSLKIQNFRKNFPMYVWLGINNKGNAPALPERVAIDVYDVSGTKLITSLEGKTEESVPSFSRGLIKTVVKHELSEGSYWGDVKVFNNGQVVRQEKVIFEVLPPVKIDEVAKNVQVDVFKTFIGGLNFLSWPFILVYLLIIVEVIIIVRKFLKPKEPKEWESPQ